MARHALTAALAALAVAAAGAMARAQTPEAGDPAAGEKIFNQCKICHTVEEGKNKIGPSLYGVVGRKAGTEAGYSYSTAMKSADLTWTPENLDKYLTNPKALVPGNKMAFAGLKSEADRRNVIAYLAKQGARK